MERAKWEEERKKWERTDLYVSWKTQCQLCDTKVKIRGGRGPVAMLTRRDIPQNADGIGASVSEHTLHIREEVHTSPGMEGSAGELPFPSADSVCATVMLAFMGSPLASFRGSTSKGEGESIEDWLEKFSLVASTYKWTPQFKMANLIVRLEGQAKAVLST